MKNVERPNISVTWACETHKHGVACLAKVFLQHLPNSALVYKLTSRRNIINLSLRRFIEWNNCSKWERSPDVLQFEIVFCTVTMMKRGFVLGMEE